MLYIKIRRDALEVILPLARQVDETGPVAPFGTNYFFTVCNVVIVVVVVVVVVEVEVEVVVNVSFSIGIIIYIHECESY